MVHDGILLFLYPKDGPAPSDWPLVLDSISIISAPLTVLYLIIKTLGLLKHYCYLQEVHENLLHMGLEWIRLNKMIVRLKLRAD